MNSTLLGIVFHDIFHFGKEGFKKFQRNINNKQKNMVLNFSPKFLIKREELS